MIKTIGWSLLMLSVVGVASATIVSGPDCRTISAPEIDPASLMSGLTMLLGGLAVVRGRRSK